ncbi:urate hydroxylase PuuD [Vibrio ostreae]|uniref:Urate hydroxylase PuuD n=1 Tax=Vibrio ostreae TaxID=2841925 RepID=A0A975U8E3_9VIBR|nr:urate hydroxylase PuuD [Vibrio ostreae]QXO16196.1 urate hydroxylase PuuD [Vibrio ostreae]
MWPQLYEWLALFIKWFHVICGIAWIGASFYFTWLDNSLETPPKWKKTKASKVTCGPYTVAAFMK